MARYKQQNILMARQEINTEMAGLATFLFAAATVAFSAVAYMVFDVPGLVFAIGCIALFLANVATQLSTSN